MRCPDRYGFAGVLSGYFKPFDNQLADPRRLVSPFNGNIILEEQNTPLDEVQELPVTAVIPRFWLAAGGADGQAVADAEVFRQGLRLWQRDVPLTLTPGCGHTFTAWRAEIPLMLTWMTRGLASGTTTPAVA